MLWLSLWLSLRSSTWRRVCLEGRSVIPGTPNWGITVALSTAFAFSFSGITMIALFLSMTLAWKHTVGLRLFLCLLYNKNPFWIYFLAICSIRKGSEGSTISVSGTCHYPRSITKKEKTTIFAFSLDSLRSFCDLPLILCSLEVCGLFTRCSC